MNRVKIGCGILLSVLLVFFVGANAVASYSNGENAEPNSYELADIVAYVDGEPVYYSEVVYFQGIFDICYHTLQLQGDADERVLAVAEEGAHASIREMVSSIAEQRAILSEAEDFGFSVSDEEIRDYQESERQRLANELEPQALQGILNEYQELYQRLGITEQEFLDTYDYTQSKSQLLSRSLIENHLVESFKDKSPAEDFDWVAWSREYYDVLRSKMEIEFADE
jgi:hypothetical protein